MSEKELAEKMGGDALRLLKLISIYTGVEERRELWIKDYALHVLIFHGIINKVFETYDYAPYIMLWHGRMRAVNISQEALADINEMRKLGLVKKLRLATSKYRFVTAYIVSERGLRVLEHTPREVVKPVVELFTENGQPAEVVLKENGQPYLRYPSGREVEVPILKIKDVEYSSEPIYNI